MSGLGRCRQCRQEFPRATTGRPRAYCSDRCRVAAHRQRKRRSVHFSSATCDWATPPDLFEELNREFEFTLDPCSSSTNAKCASYFTVEDDGLKQRWAGRVFMNPPYGRQISSWMAKAWESTHAGAELVVCLVPARTDTAWWHDYAARGEIRFLKGRLRFGDAATSAPFPSAVVVFRNPSAVTKAPVAGAPTLTEDRARSRIGAPRNSLRRNL